MKKLINDIERICLELKDSINKGINEKHHKIYDLLNLIGNKN